MGKNKKEHRKKVAKRNESISNQRKTVERMQAHFFEEMIKKEKESGAFENNKPFPAQGELGLEGPKI